MRKIIFSTLFCLLFVFNLPAQEVTQGELKAIDKTGKFLNACPLKHTAVKAEISGFLSRVSVTQEFENNFSEKIEAVYVFPLPQNAAVDDMTMHIGDRIVKGKVMEREKARETYEESKTNGQIASLLNQERPNIFTQAVANILPKEKVIIEISYVEMLKYENGAYEFSFPMVVGPRYIPGQATGKQGSGFSSDTDRVPDGSKITPMPAKERAGHDISIEVKLDAGVPIENITSKSHLIEQANLSVSSAVLKLKNGNTIPNKDFILRYSVAGKKISDAIITHRNEKGGYFTLILQPPANSRGQKITPKEIVFVLDTSGSMEGFPIEKAKEAMRMALKNLNPIDTFNLITFAGDTHILFEKPVRATAKNLRKAQKFLASRQGEGGTEMMTAIKAALEPSDSQQHIRVVCFMTDGYVGDDMEIIDEIQKHPNARIFSFGIGDSVNRFLLDKMAEEGRGEVEYVSLEDDGSAAAKRFQERVRNPLLTDVSIDFSDLSVADVYPKRINDLFSAKPIIIHGRFTKAEHGVIRLKGKSLGRDIVREISVNFPANEPNHDVLATLWARSKINEIMSQDYEGIQDDDPKPEIRIAITDLGIKYHLMTQFTSFVAVEEKIVTEGGQPRRIEVPIEMPEGVSHEGVFGASFVIQGFAGRRSNRNAPAIVNRPANVKSLLLSKTVNGVEIFLINNKQEAEEAISQFTKPITLTKPEYPQGTQKAPGKIRVKVTVDNNGNVTSAKALSGPALFQKAVEEAAMRAKFSLPKLSVELVKIAGTIVYDFVNDKNIIISPELSDIQTELKSDKYDSVIGTLIERLKNNQLYTSKDTIKFVEDDKAQINVRLKELNPETIKAMEDLGFEVLTQTASTKSVVGKIAVEKIESLAKLDAVSFISPQNF